MNLRYFIYKESFYFKEVKPDYLGIVFFFENIKITYIYILLIYDKNPNREKRTWTETNKCLRLTHIPLNLKWNVWEINKKLINNLKI